MGLTDLDFYITKTLEWIKHLQAMQNDKMLNSIYGWLSKEIGETTILLDLLKRIKDNEMSTIIMEKKNGDNSL